MPTHSQSHSLALRTLGVFGGILLLWTGAWILKVNLEQVIPPLRSESWSFAFWTTAKLLCWILPASWLIRLSGRSLKDVFNLAKWHSWLAWGLCLGLLIAATGILPKVMSGKPLLPNEPSFPLFSVLTVAPVFEEYLVRGAILPNLGQNLSFSMANTLSALLFVALHLPGWFFMGSLTENLTKPIGGALSIFLLGLVFGFAAKRSDSVLAGMIAHCLNNFSSLA